MCKVIIHTTLSLDGFMARPDRSIDWAFQFGTDAMVDEILIHLAPILLGEGIRLFDHLGSADIVLDRTEIASTAQVTSLRFRIKR